MKALGTSFVILAAMVGSCAHAHAADSSRRTLLPCPFDGSLLRDSRGDIVQFTSNAMKQRATSKEDLSAFMKPLDFRSTMVLNVLVSDSGEVACVKTISGIPMARKPTEEAVRHWKFRVAITAGKPVAYMGWLEFTLCNINCGSEGYSVTLLK